jgi:hypothetical protein
MVTSRSKNHTMGTLKRRWHPSKQRTCQFPDTTTSLGSNKTFRTSPFLPEVDHEVFNFNFYPSSDPSETGDSVRLSTDTSCMKLCWVFRDLKTSWSLPEVDHEVFKSLKTQHSFIQLVSVESLTESPVSDGP